MYQRSLLSSLCLAGVLCGLALPSALQAQSVGPGWNCFDTVSGPTVFDGVQWIGVPLGSNYNFGGSIGTQPIGQTDTIIQRLSPAVTTPGGTQSLAVTALQLQTLNPVTLGGGPVGYYFITLDSTDLGLDTGLLTIDSFPSNSVPGTFHDFFDVYFDIRFGSLTGPIVAANQSLELDASGDWWPTLPSPDTPLAHHDNSGMGDWHVVTTDPSVPDVVEQDFYPTGIPEPSGLALLGLGVLCLAIKTRRGRK